jgi:protein TonB
VTALALGSLIAAVAAGTPSLKLFFASDFTDQVYQQKTYTKVAGTWKMPAEAPEPGKKAVVITTIMKDGTTAGAKLHYESGSEAWDAAAVAAIENASPFDPLPKGYSGASVEVHFHFEYGE